MRRREINIYREHSVSGTPVFQMVKVLAYMHKPYDRFYYP